ncbi:MAG: putative DNA binding domain-containing protein [bacterium]|nr:putative DNA binding domain-containing protein [bacterium]
MEGVFRKWLRLVFRSKPKVLPIWANENNLEPLIRSRPPDPDELALGWAAGRDEIDNRQIHQLKAISQEARDTHFYVIGASGSGKTKFLESLIKQDIENGLGFGVVDPHGDLTEDIKGYLYAIHKDTPELLQERVVLIDPTNKERVVTFNPLEITKGESAASIASELTEAFKKIWHDAWGARMEDLLKNTLIALIQNNLTLAELPLFLTDSEARRKILEKVEHGVSRQYFQHFNSLPRRTQDEWMESTLNKVNAFLFDDSIRQLLASPKSSFNLREIMDEGKILLVKLDKGRLKGSADLLGSLLLAKIQAAAFSRTDTPELQRRKFYLYIDEFQNFATESFIGMLAEARKYRLALLLVHQNLAQLSTTLRASILSNCRLQAYFQISRDDSNILAKESLASIYQDPIGWEQYIQALQELPRRACVIKNKIDGGVIAVRTLNLPSPHEVAEMDEKDFTEKVAASEIGKPYLRERKKIEEEYKERRNMLTRSDESVSFREKKITEVVNYEEIIKGGENDQVEFKVSIRWDFKRKAVNKFLEFIIAKSISAFMNVNGGRLFVGVSDSGEIGGIENDYAVVHHKNKDGFLLQLTQIINQYLGKTFYQYISVKIIPMKGKDVCVIEVAKSKTPVFLKNGDKEEFYIRASASSQPMSMKEANEYIRSHFHRS